MKYQFIDHTADFGVHIFARSRKALFQNAAEAMFSLIIDTIVSQKTETIQLTLKSDSLEGLLMSWLRALLSLFNLKNCIVLATSIRIISNTSLSADVTIVHPDPEKDTLNAEIKAVTYHGFKVEKNQNQWFAQVIFDA